MWLITARVLKWGRNQRQGMELCCRTLVLIAIIVAQVGREAISYDICRSSLTPRGEVLPLECER